MHQLHSKIGLSKVIRWGLHCKFCWLRNEFWNVAVGAVSHKYLCGLLRIHLSSPQMWGVVMSMSGILYYCRVITPFAMQRNVIGINRTANSINSIRPRVLPLLHVFPLPQKHLFLVFRWFSKPMCFIIGSHPQKTSFSCPAYTFEFKSGGKGKKRKKIARGVWCAFIRFLDRVCASSKVEKCVRHCVRRI